MDCTIHVANTKALISFAVTAKLICIFVFAYAKSRFSHNEAHIIGDCTYCSVIMVLTLCRKINLFCKYLNGWKTVKW